MYIQQNKSKIYKKKMQLLGVRPPTCHGYNTRRAAYVSTSGFVDRYGHYVDFDDHGVRPALYLNLSSSIWESAGTVSSDGTEKDYHEHSLKHIKSPAGLMKNGEEYDQCEICKEIFNKKTLPGYSTSYVKSFKVSKGKKSFTAKWKKQSKANQKKFNGYQIRYSTRSDMSGAKTTTAGKSSKSKKIKNLVAKKKYYVQVRTYTKKNGSTFYSKWSSKKAVKTKK